MKILHLCKKYPNAMGGDAIVVSNLRKQQELAGNEVVIVTSNCKEVQKDRRIYKVGLKDTPAKLDTITPKRLVSLLILFFRMFGILARERPDVIHTHSIDMAFFASFAARAYGIPIVHTFHIVTFYDESQSATRRKTELWLTSKVQPAAITAPNMYDVKKLQAAGLKQAVLLPNGVDTAFWLPQDRAPKGPAFVFVAIGRLERQKGYTYLIKAAALLRRVGAPSPFQVTIIGEGSQAVLLRQLAHSLRVEDIVSFVGRKSPEDTRTLLRQASAAVFPSLYESTPLTMLEAWSSAVPAIVTPVGIVRDAPADFDAAFIVPPQDEQSLMQTMHRCMMDDKVRHHVATKGRQESQKYAWPKIAQTAQTIYGNLQ